MTVVETTQALVQIPSVNPIYEHTSRGEGKVADWLAHWAQRHSVPWEISEVLPGRYNIIFHLKSGEVGPHVLLAAHTDTVGVDQMTTLPFGGAICDGRIFGRGSADMKGPLAAMLHTLLNLRDDRSWAGEVTLACVIDEEFRARGIKALLKADSAYDFAIVGEPTCLKVVRGCKGCLRFSFEAIGRAAHSSTPELGRNAIVAMSRAVVALDRYFREELALENRAGFGSSTGSVGLIEGGTGINVVASSCRASVDIRLLPGQRWEEVYKVVQRRIVESTHDLPDICWRFDENPFEDPPYETGEETRLVRIATDLQAKGPAEVVSYSCDASKIGAHGIPCIILGPGDIAQAHTENESIGIEELKAGVRCYTELVLHLLSHS